MTTYEVIKNFFNNIESKKRAANVWSNHDRVFSYSTCICQRIAPNTYIYNATKYSPSISKHQSYARRELANPDFKVLTVDDIPIGTSLLDLYQPICPKLCTK